MPIKMKNCKKRSCYEIIAIRLFLEIIKFTMMKLLGKIKIVCIFFIKKAWGINDILT